MTNFTRAIDAERFSVAAAALFKEFQRFDNKGLPARERDNTKWADLPPEVKANWSHLARVCVKAWAEA